MMAKILITLLMLLGSGVVTAAEYKNDWNLIYNESLHREYFEYKSNDLLRAIVDKESGDLMVLDENYNNHFPLRIGRLLYLDDLVLSGEVRKIPYRSGSNLFCFQRFGRDDNGLIGNTYLALYEKNKFSSYAFLSNSSCNKAVYINAGKITIKSLAVIDAERALFYLSEIVLLDKYIEIKSKNRINLDSKYHFDLILDLR